MPLAEKKYLTEYEVAELLMVSTSAISLWTEKKILKSTENDENESCFNIEDVQRFAKEHGIVLNLSNDNEVKVLIVDDEPLFCEYLQDLLETVSDDVVVKVSHNGFDAGVQLREFAPDVVLLDVIMPGFDGFRVCKQIKQDPQFKHIKVFAMTGNKTEQIEGMLMAAGAEACFEKPIDVNELLDKLSLEHIC